MPRVVWKNMGKGGFLCTGIPEQYGGSGADFLHAVIIIEELAKCNFSGLGNRLHSDVAAPYILDYATEEQKLKYLPGCVTGDIITAIGMTEPNAGSDLAAMGIARNIPSPVPGGTSGSTASWGGQTKS